MSNVISSDVEIKGTVMFGKDLIADGRIEGEILSSGKLTVGQNGSVQGDIHAGTVSIYGRVNGNVIADERCELKTDAELVGDVKTPRLKIEDGVTFMGRCEVGPVDPKAAKTETAA